VAAPARFSAARASLDERNRLGFTVGWVANVTGGAHGLAVHAYAAEIHSL